MSAGRSGAPVDVLLVEDDPGDVRLVEDAFESADFDVALYVATDGDEAITFLSSRKETEAARYPNLVLLDLNLPRVSGFEVLETIREDPELVHLPVVVLSSSSDPEDVRECYERYANAFLPKPTDPDEFASLVKSIEEFWFERARLPPDPE